MESARWMLRGEVITLVVWSVLALISSNKDRADLVTEDDADGVVRRGEENTRGRIWNKMAVFMMTVLV